jgi:transmembrane sensor
MDEVILRSFREEISAIEERRLQNWRNESPENEARYHELSRIWQLEPSGLPPGKPPTPPASSRIITRARLSKVQRLLGRSGVSDGRSGWTLRIAAAAAVILLAIGIAWAWTARPWGAAFGVSEFATGSQQTVTVSLADGSFVRLAPNSRLRLPPGGEKRQVWLDGRAYFAVKSDPAHPFAVHTSAGDAMVLGTRFELKVSGDDLRLAVVEGHVELSSGASSVAVGAGEVSQMKRGGVPSVIKVKDVTQLLDWPDGLLIFQSTPLDQVGIALERHFGVRVDIADSATAERVVTGWFAEESLDEVLTAVCRATQTHCSLDGKHVAISP